MKLVEGVRMLIASGLIAYFVVWLAAQNQSISRSIRNSVTKIFTGLGLAVLAFLSVFREGLEYVVFTLANLSTHAKNVA